MTKLDEYLQITRNLVVEAGGVTQYDQGDNPYTTFIRHSLRRYSIDKPLQKVSAIIGTDSKYLTLNEANTPGYVDGFSSIELIEAAAPVVANNDRPNYIDRDQWELYRDDTALRIYFINHQPRVSDTIRVTYTVLHTINELDDETVDSVPTQDREAIILYAAYQALLSLAAKFAGTSDPTLRADVVNYRTKSLEYRTLAQEHKKMYEDFMSDPIKAASIVRDIDFRFGFSDVVPWLTHRNR